MGVDYSAHYGLGFKIKLIEFDDELTEETEKTFTTNLLDEKLDQDNYGWFEVGEDTYGGPENELFVYILEPFKDGLSNLEFLKTKLVSHLNEIGISPDGEFDLQGGLEVW